jgi:hypothetical protein
MAGSLSRDVLADFTSHSHARSFTCTLKPLYPHVSLKLHFDIRQRACVKSSCPMPSSASCPHAWESLCSESAHGGQSHCNSKTPCGVWRLCRMYGPRIRQETHTSSTGGLSMALIVSSLKCPPLRRSKSKQPAERSLVENYTAPFRDRVLSQKNSYESCFWSRRSGITILQSTDRPRGHLQVAIARPSAVDGRITLLARRDCRMIETTVLAPEMLDPELRKWNYTDVEARLR